VEPVACIDPLGDPRWMRLLEQAPGATVFHHPAWLRLLRDQYGYGMTAVVVEGADGALLAGLPLARVDSRLTGRRLVAVPFSDVCPPLIADDRAGRGLGDGVREAARAEGRALEVRGVLPGTPAGGGERFLHHRLPLGGDPEAVLRAARSQVRRGMAKARRSGVLVARRDDIEALDRFYALHVQTRRRQGVPVQPRRFVRRLGDLLAAGLGYVAIAELDGRPIAAGVFLAYGETLTYKYGASEPAALDARPNNAIFGDAIAWACAHDLGWLDFGRTDLDNPGLAAFKRSWGAEERVLAYTRLPPRAGEAGLGSVRRAAGAVIRRSPSIVGRAIGAATYRHFG
jgi:CelD/BcsL family acetyltransferase involved in cellulose biosynthesis